MTVSTRRRPSRLLAGVLGLVILVVIGGLLVSTIVTIAIWPGEVKLVAPFFCTDAQPDAFVVADTYSPQPGETTTNFSLYCMGPRGDAADHGFMKPFLLTALLNGIALTILISLSGLAFRRRRRAKHPDPGAGEPEPSASSAPARSVPGPGSTAGPFVD